MVNRITTDAEFNVAMTTLHQLANTVHERLTELRASGVSEDDIAIRMAALVDYAADLYREIAAYVPQ